MITDLQIKDDLVHSMDSRIQGVYSIQHIPSGRFVYRDFYKSKSAASGAYNHYLIHKIRDLYDKYTGTNELNYWFNTAVKAKKFGFWHMKQDKTQPSYPEIYNQIRRVIEEEVQIVEIV